MKCTSIDDENERIEFVTRASKWFADNPTGTTYTDADITAGCYFAVRWGLGNDCVLIFKVEDEPILYQNCIDKKEPI